MHESPKMGDVVIYRPPMADADKRCAPAMIVDVKSENWADIHVFAKVGSYMVRRVRRAEFGSGGTLVEPDRACWMTKDEYRHRRPDAPERRRVRDFIPGGVTSDPAQADVAAR